MGSRRKLQDEEVYEYLVQVSVRETPIQVELREYTLAHEKQAHMMTAPEQVQFLAFLIKLMNAKQVIEVGVYTGYATLAMALVLSEKGQLIACDIDKRVTQIGEQFWEKANVNNRIDLRIASGLKTLQQLLDKGQADTFDLIFIDADKQNYQKYYELALQLIHSGGLIIFDNVLAIGSGFVHEKASSATQAIAKLNDNLKNDKRVDITMLPISEGMTLVRKRASD